VRPCALGAERRLGADARRPADDRRTNALRIRNLSDSPFNPFVLNSWHNSGAALLHRLVPNAPAHFRTGSLCCCRDWRSGRVVDDATFPSAWPDTCNSPALALVLNLPVLRLDPVLVLLIGHGERGGRGCAGQKECDRKLVHARLSRRLTSRRVAPARTPFTSVCSRTSERDGCRSRRSVAPEILRDFFAPQQPLDMASLVEAFV